MTTIYRFASATRGNLGVIQEARTRLVSLPRRTASFAMLLVATLPALAQPQVGDAVRQAMQQGAAAMTSGNFVGAAAAYERGHPRRADVC